MATYLPFVKLASGKYLIGVHERQLQLKGSGCLVRTGEGYMPLDEYLKQYSRSECIKLNKLIRKEDGSVKNTVLNLLRKHKADNKSVARYEKKCSQELDLQFQQLMDQVKELDQLMSSSTPAEKATTPKQNIGEAQTEKHSDNNFTLKND